MVASHDAQRVTERRGAGHSLPRWRFCGECERGVREFCLHAWHELYMRPRRRWAPCCSGYAAGTSLGTGVLQHRMGLWCLLSGSSTCNCCQAFPASFPLLCELQTF